MQNIYICDVLTQSVHCSVMLIKQLSTISLSQQQYLMNDYFKYSFAYYECSSFIDVYILHFSPSP